MKKMIEKVKKKVIDVYVVLSVAARAMTLNTSICIRLCLISNDVIPHHSRHFLWEWVLHKPTVFVVCVNKLLFDFVCYLYKQTKNMLKHSFFVVCGLTSSSPLTATRATATRAASAFISGFLLFLYFSSNFFQYMNDTKNGKYSFYIIIHNLKE